MKRQEHILSELQTLGSTLAAREILLPYTVPPGYFEQLPSLMLELVMLDQETVAFHFPSKPAFTVPDGYFDNLPSALLKRVKELPAENDEELADIAPVLAGIPKTTPYTTPAGYFENLELPIGYDSASDEIQALSPLLASLDKAMPYSVPGGYFDKLKTPVSEARVVSMTSSRKWMRYAAAAVVTGLIATLTLIFVNNNTSVPIEETHAWIEKSMKKVSTEEISDFVQLTEDPLAVVQTNAKDDIKALMKDVSDKEIQQFLSETQAAEAVSDDDLIFN